MDETVTVEIPAVSVEVPNINNPLVRRLLIFGAAVGGMVLAGAVSALTNKPEAAAEMLVIVNENNLN